MKGLREFLKKTAGEVDAEIENFFPKKFSAGWYSKHLGKPEFALDSGAAQGAISSPVWDFLSRGGKRWRPALMLLACEAVGGRKADALPFTPIPELAHSGSVIVDDVEDNSALRRGKPSLHIEYGVDIAINAGNALYFLPLLPLALDKKLSPEKKSLVYALYVSEMSKLSFGQGIDIFWHNGHKDATEQEYLQMCSLKTGSLARMAVGLGATLGGASRRQFEALTEFATSIGVAFQIQDDILNIKPNEGWGKETGDDIKEGKRTLMAIHAFSALPEKERARLTWILDSRNNSDNEVREAIDMLEKSGSIEYAKKTAASLVSGSWAKLEKSLPATRAKGMLKEFAEYVVERSV